MTHVELKDLLVSRIGWDQYPSDFALTLDAENKTSESDRVFNANEHPFVTLDNIYSTMETPNASAAQFNAHLKRMRDQTILLVLSDVFRVSDLQDDVITGRENIFDNAISKRMAITVGETILTSTRSNRVERIIKEQQKTLFFELNGNADSSSSRANPNFPTYVGLKSRYGQEIQRLRDEFNQEKMLDVNTLRLPNYEDTETNVILYT